MARVFFVFPGRCEKIPGRGGWGLRGPKPRGRGFQPLHPDSAKGPAADKRQFPPATTRGTGLRKNALTAAQKKTRGPGQMGPARPHTPRQRFSTPAPRFGEGTCRRQTAVSACHCAGDEVTEKCPDGGAEKKARFRGRGLARLRGYSAASSATRTKT